MTRTEVWLTEMMCHFKSIDDMRRYWANGTATANHFYGREGENK